MSWSSKLTARTKIASRSVAGSACTRLGKVIRRPNVFLPPRESIAVTSRCASEAGRPTSVASRSPEPVLTARGWSAAPWIELRKRRRISKVSFPEEPWATTFAKSGAASLTLLSHLLRCQPALYSSVSKPKTRCARRAATSTAAINPSNTLSKLPSASSAVSLSCGLLSAQRAASRSWSARWTR